MQNLITNKLELQINTNKRKKSCFCTFVLFTRSRYTKLCPGNYGNHNWQDAEHANHTVHVWHVNNSVCVTVVPKQLQSGSVTATTSECWPAKILISWSVCSQKVRLCVGMWTARTRARAHTHTRTWLWTWLSCVFWPFNLSVAPNKKNKKKKKHLTLWNHNLKHPRSMTSSLCDTVVVIETAIFPDEKNR